jgi:hypothetical protein
MSPVDRGAENRRCRMAKQPQSEHSSPQPATRTGSAALDATATDLSPQVEVIMKVAVQRAVGRQAIRQAAEAGGIGMDVLVDRANQEAAKARAAVELEVLDLDRLQQEFDGINAEIAAERSRPRLIKILTGTAAISLLVWLVVVVISLVALGVTAIGGEGQWLFGWLGWAVGGISAAIIVGQILAVGLVSQRHERQLEKTAAARSRDSLEAQLDAKREGLVAGLVEERLVPALTKALNDLQAPSHSRDLGMESAAGLSEPLTPRLEVPTAAQFLIERRLAAWSGGSIGVAGPRGSGKTTLLEAVCRVQGDEDEPERIAVLASAPVQYEPRDFVLYLFGEVCKAVLEAYRVPPRAIASLSPGPEAPRSGLLTILKRLYVLPARRLLLGGPVERRLPRVPPGLASTAVLLLQEIRFQQTYTSGWGGGFNLGVTASAERGQAFARTAMTFPEVVNEFRGFVQQAATNHLMVIAIDEMDKMASREEAHRFLNDIKGVFGIRNCFFLLSVSEDALSSFERRGLPIRDVLDSAFDDIVRVEYMSFVDSADMLRRRVIGLPVPFLALCHCMSGGLPRDLLRAARGLAEMYETRGSLSIDGVAQKVGETDLHAKATATEIAGRRLGQPEVAGRVLHVARTLKECGHQDLVATCRDLCDGILRELGSMNASREAVDLAVEVASYGYFVGTVVEVFSDRLDEEAVKPGVNPERSIEMLAQARQAFSTDAREAWLLVSTFREAWGRPGIDPPGMPGTAAIAS